MKIEIAESLMLSWLRHAKSCQMVQLNWKPSVISWELHNENTVEALMKSTDTYFSEKHGLNLFKKNSSLSQFLQQGEIDALGIEINSGGVQKIYAVDVAFHESGLNYGCKEETIARVMKKMIRSAMILHGFFNMTNGEIIFASPKVYGIINNPLQEYLQELQQLLQCLGLNFHFSFVCNDDFRDEIYNVVTALSNTVADTSELFMRAIQMSNLFADNSTAKTVKERKQRIDRVGIAGEAGLGAMKIGILVKSTFIRLVGDGLIDSNEVERLQLMDYSKRTFNINYPILKEYDATLSMSDQRNVNGYPRYYTDIYTIQEKRYLLCTIGWRNLAGATSKLG
ncbi:hypothetical protein [Paenibacillus harenae]|uniref:hypothetical protein n=1 Tax=Paenibacillus harenae TaxID=306543 RepID=UPI0027940CA3|nr:hypothetical protein [Paenibacillus harenae]MDQ0059471.1 hypothetical protein [Paenibacillus harenae]